MKLLKNTYNQATAPIPYYSGLKYYNNKQWQYALQAFQKAIQARPKHPQSHFKLGLCHMKLGHFEEAYHHLKQANLLAPHNTQWQVQLDQCSKRLGTSTSIEPQQSQSPAPRILQSGVSDSINISIKKKLLLVPSDYNHRALADILPFVKHYQQAFDVYVIIRELEADIIKTDSHTLVKNGTSYGEFLKFTADYIIDAGSLNYGYRITDASKWVSVWHGIPYKKMFVDLDTKHLPNAIRYGMAYDCMVSMSDFYTNTFLRGSMRYGGEILQLGCAKIDKLLDPQSAINTLRSRYKLPENKKVVLYVPNPRPNGGNIFPFNPAEILAVLGDDYCFLVSEDNYNDILTQYKLAPNVFMYREISADAVLIADILISDYHPMIGLFKQYGKPVVLFQYDYEAFIRTHPERRKELKRLTTKQFVATRESALYNLNWPAIRDSATSNTPSEIFTSDYLKISLGIPLNKKIILYAPTFREKGVIELPFSPSKLIKKLGEDYVIVTKLHYLNQLSRSYNHVVDCTDYSELVDLMNIADVLISDYSSLILDFALLNKPIVLFQYDHFQYMQQRGTYFDFEQYLPAKHIINREIDLYNLDWSNLASDNSRLAQQFYPIEDGCSTQRIVDALAFDARPRQSKDIIFLVNDLNQIGGIHTFVANMAKHYKETYNSRIYLLAINEFAESNTEYHQFNCPDVDFKLSARYLAGGCANILQNTDGIVISLQFSAHLHFQKYLTHAKSILMFHGDVKDIISREMYGPHLDWLNHGNLYNYQKLLLLTQSAVDLLAPHVNKEVAEKLGYMHNSIDAEYCPITSQHAHHAAVISRLDADKNIWALIDLGKEILGQNQDIVINIYGDGQLKDEFQATIVAAGLSDTLILHGFESNKEKIFSVNSSLLLLSKSEGFPLVILEAYANGKPVIVFDSFTAASDIVKHKETGFLVPYGDYAAVVDGIKQADTIDTANISALFSQFENKTIFARWNQLFTELDAMTSTTTVKS